MQVIKSVTKIEPTITKVTQPKRRVAAYCRVSSSFDEQLVSLETQKSHYTEYIQSGRIGCLQASTSMKGLPERKRRSGLLCSG